MAASRRLPSSAQQAEISLPEAEWRRRFRQRLRAWYARNARDLPWRRSADPYRIWVSEIMLQQTQVATAEPYFERFVRVFPTIAALAAAEEAEVLRCWEGLGYYRRARQMHQAAQIMVDQHGGRFPREFQAVYSLPGIGRYTAGAILSIAFDQRQPILEANTMRLFSRLLGFHGDPTTAAGQRLLWAMAEAVLPQKNVGAFNQALMELGSEVCRLRRPLCHDCPVVRLCTAKAEGREQQIPPPKQKPSIQRRREAAVAVYRRGRVLLVLQPDGGRWAGLWDFPRLQVHEAKPTTLRREICRGVEELTGLSIALGEPLMTLKHGVTRYRITLECFRAECLDDKAASADKSDASTAERLVCRWVEPASLSDYPLNTTGRQLAQLLERFGQSELA